jgi:hypothetical protein
MYQDSKLGLTQKLSQTLLALCPQRLCGLLFRGLCVSPINLLPKTYAVFPYFVLLSFLLDFYHFLLE